jgi:hypothetical protein
MAAMRRRSSTRRRRRPTTSHDLGLGSILAVAGLLVALVSGGTYLYFKSQSSFIETDPETLCPRSGGPSSVTGILLDISDSLADPQRLELENELNRLRHGIPRFGLIELYSVGNAGQPLQRSLLRMCNPGDGHDLNRLYQNPELARRKWSDFDSKVSAALQRELSSSSNSTSPIFEAIQAMAVRSFGQPDYDNVPKRLVIVSDLLQNVPGELNMYDGVPSFDSFKSSPYFRRVASDLRGVRVSVYYLARANTTTQSRAHVEFWNSYLLAQGAVVDTLTKVYGAR